MKKYFVFISIIALVGLTGLTVNCGNSKTPHTGYVECEEVDVASKIPGRIIEIKVKAGDIVKKGDVMAILETNDVKAKVEQAKAGLEAAVAQLEMAQHGARKEEKAMAQRQLNTAANNLEIVERTFNRILKVYKEGGVSEQDKDMAEFRYKVAQDDYAKAKSYMDMINNGTRVEQIEALKANVRAMQEKINEANSYLSESTIKAPQDAEVRQVNSQVGEIVTAGFPIISMLEQKKYVIFNLRESEFNGLKIGDSMKVFIPALNKESNIKIYYIAPMADFAKYEATREKGSWDVKSFEVRASLADGMDGIRSGMSIRISEKL